MSNHHAPLATAAHLPDWARSTAHDLPGRSLPDRCPAAHTLDARSCEGAPDAVQIIDQAGGGVAACLLHGAVLLASLDQARVYPLGGPVGCAITVYVRARSLPPFDFLAGPGVSRTNAEGRTPVFPASKDADERDNAGQDAR